MIRPATASRPIVLFLTDDVRPEWLRPLRARYEIETRPLAPLAPGDLDRPAVGCVLVDTGATPADRIGGLLLALDVPGHVPLVVLRDGDDEAGALAAVRAGAADIVPKSRLVDGERLRQTLRFAVERHMARATERQAERRLLAARATEDPAALAATDGAGSAAHWELEDALAANRRRLRHEVALADCSAALLAGDTPGQLRKALSAVRVAVDASGAFVDVNREDPELGLCSSLTDVVTAPGVVIERERWARVPWSKMPLAHAALSRGAECRFRLSDLEGEERALYEGTGMLSELDVPIFVGGRWVGLVGFVDHVDGRDWADDEVRLLRTTGEMIGAYWERQEAGRRLRETLEAARRRARYDRALARCSQVLLGSHDAEGLRTALAALLEATRATYGFVEVNEDHPELGLCSRTVIEAERGGAVAPASHDDYWKVVPWSRMPDSYARLSTGRPFAFAVEDLGAVERELYLDDPYPIKSELNIPIFRHGEWVGLIGFADADRVIDWSDEDVEMLRRAAEMIAAYWERDAALTELEELLRSKDEFLASVSHELRTPLTAALGMAHELRDRAPDLEQAEIEACAAIIASQTSEVADLVEDLLVAARKDLSTLPCASVAVDLTRAIDDVVEGLRVEVGLSVDAAARVAWADPLRVRQIVRNLVTNAVRYGGDDIVIGAHVTDETAVVAVADDGPALLPDMQQRIWEPYQRARQQPTQPLSVGLGLTVSRRLARRMGGDLVYVRRDQRNVFELRLPAVPGVAQAS